MTVRRRDPVVLMALLGAAFAAAGGCVFGVGVARLIWADDLNHALAIDAIRGETEKHLRATIAHLEKEVKVLHRTVDYFKAEVERVSASGRKD